MAEGVMSDSSTISSHVVHCRGAIATEISFIEAVDAALADLADLATPVRLIVPSKSLRQHILRRLVRERGALAGLVVQTAYSGAREVIERAGASPPPGDAFFDLVVRRLARDERSLASNLETLDDGFGPVAGVVRDLLDAGFQPGHEEAVLDRIDDLERPVAANRLERARAIVRVAARSYEAMFDSDLWRSTHAFEMAAALLRQKGATMLPSSAVLIHGFADVTGLVADFLDALTRTFSTSVYLDFPDRPGDSTRSEPGLAFLERLQSTFAHLDFREASTPPHDPDVTVTEGVDVEDEARWVAERVVSLIENGVAAEDIGVVARNFEGVAYPLRRHFLRLGVPFSGIGETVAGGGSQRALLRLADILRLGPASPVDIWIESRGAETDRTALLLALRQIGVVRLEDLVSLRVEGELTGGIRIPFSFQPDEIGDRGASRTVSAESLRRARERAAALVGVFDAWPNSATARSHAENTVRVIDALGGPADDSGWSEVIQRIGALAAELSTLEDLERREWQRIFSDRLSGLGEDCIGGAGGGVQLLNTTEARARTFEHLFLVGLNRGVFPRVASDDSMLPDAVRSRLERDVLPEMPVRARSAEEERYLFAQLLSSAPRVHASWHLAARGSVMARSPFVADLIREGAPDPVAPPVWSSARADLGPRPPYEHAVLAAGGGHREELPPTMAAALADAGLAEAGLDLAELARSRVDVLRQVDPERPQEGPIPWFGFIGGVYPIEENGPSVTQVEGFAECPWSNFVTRRLDVAPMPDPQLGLPDPKGRLVGEVVHRVLEDVVRAGLDGACGVDVDEAAQREPKTVRWPDETRFEEILAHASHRVASEAGLAPLGMSALLAARARPYLDVARRSEWGSDGSLSAVLAAEVSGVAQIESVEWPLRFRADRIDLGDAGLILIDYKTGKPVSSAQGAPTRRKDLMKEVEKGRMLQAAAYAAASGDGSAMGRYLWLKPDIGEAKEEVRSAVVRGDEPDFMGALAEAVATIARARHEGAAFPRVEEIGKANKPDHCKYCPVAEVCRRDDSAFRRRLVEWMAKEDSGRGRAESAARDLWHLGAPAKDES